MNKKPMTPDIASGILNYYMAGVSINHIVFLLDYEYWIDQINEVVRERLTLLEDRLPDIEQSRQYWAGRCSNLQNDLNGWERYHARTVDFACAAARRIAPLEARDTDAISAIELIVKKYDALATEVGLLKAELRTKEQNV